MPGEEGIDFFKGVYSAPLKFMTMMKKKNRDGGIQDVEVRKEGPEVFANLTRDAGFKIVLGTEGQSEELLKKLLNRLLPEAALFP